MVYPSFFHASILFYTYVIGKNIPFFEEERNRAKADIEKIICGLMEYGNKLEPSVYTLCQFLYAALSHHYSFLQRTLDPTDQLHQSSIFQAVTAKHQELAAVSYPWNRKPDTPQFTGLLLHVTLLEL